MEIPGVKAWTGDAGLPTGSPVVLVHVFLSQHRGRKSWSLLNKL